MLLKNLKELFPKQPSLWLGNFPPCDSEAVNILHSHSYRLAPELHGKFKVVWFYESLLSDIKAWKIILDEMIRLINESGILVIRFRQNIHINIIEFKNFFGRNAVLADVNIIYEGTDEGVFSIALNIVRKNHEIYNNKTWSFAILTQGNKVENVTSFCKSIRELDADNKHEIVICGPKNQKYNVFNVKYHDKQYEDTHANIAQKKNDLAHFCTKENVLISHDRYKLNNDFFHGFECYGYDFDFLTIRQLYESGEKFPGYLKLSKHMKWSEVLYTDYEFHFDDNFFLNGGLLIFKNKTMKNINFNKLLFWNQGEDVELSRQMIIHSVPPRQNYFSSATTLGVSSSYTATFKKIKVRNNYPVIFFKMIKKNTPRFLKKIIKWLVKI